MESKYLDYMPDHRGMLKGSYQWTKDIRVSAIWEAREDHTKKVIHLLDSKITVQFKKVTLHLDMNNLFNVRYEEIPNLPMPGRRLRLGFTFER